MIGRRAIKGRKIGTLVFLVLSLAVIVGLGFYVRNTRIATEESKALYGGEDEAGYFPAGYMVSYTDDKPAELCGLLFLSDKIGISAAHCLDKGSKFTAGQGNFDSDTLGSTPVKSFATDSNWDRKSSDNDIGEVIFTKPQTQSGPVSIVSPVQSHCNYRVVGYGRTEADKGNLSLIRPRKGADVCISLVKDSVFYINSTKGGVCVGDSGSPIFEKNTNNVVGIISAIIVKDTKDPCYVGNTAIAVRLDKKQAFIASGQEITNPSTNNTPVAQQFTTVTVDANASLFSGFEKYLIENTTQIETILLILGVVIVGTFTMLLVF